MCDGCKLGYGITLFLPKNYQLCMVMAVIFNTITTYGYGFITVADTSRIIGGGGGGGGGGKDMRIFQICLVYQIHCLITVM